MHGGIKPTNSGQPMRKRTHPEAMLIHATKRAHERFGLRLRDSDYARMVTTIRNSNPKPIAVTRSGQRVFKCRFNGRDAFAIWKKGTIATFLPDLDRVLRTGGRMIGGDA